MVFEDLFSSGSHHFLMVIPKGLYTMALRQPNPVGVTGGVPQGTVLGPLLFLAYINDLPDCISLSCSLFGDDCLLYRKINSKTDQEVLQQDLQNLQEWSNMWLMMFNVK